MLSDKKAQIKYSRQVLLKEIGKKGQQKLQTKKITVVGIGALGTVAAELLARAGVENLLLIDRDCLEESNLQRQTLFTENDLGRSKVKVAKEKLEMINSRCQIQAEAIHLSAKNVGLLKRMDLVLDCTDNLETRFLINDFCKKEKIPLVYAAAIRTSGYVLPIFPEGPCLSCFLQEASLETCDTVGVLNTITTIIAAQQVTLALKILLEWKIEPFLFHYDSWKQQLRQIIVKKNPVCPSCNGNYIYLNRKESGLPIKFCSSGVFQIQGPVRILEEIKKKLENIGRVIVDGETLRFETLTLFQDGRVLIKADSEKEALAIYSKYVGN